jgi:hypothetical protein
VFVDMTGVEVADAAAEHDGLDPLATLTRRHLETKGPSEACWGGRRRLRSLCQVDGQPMDCTTISPYP